MKVLVQLRSTEPVHAAALSMTPSGDLTTPLSAAVPELTLDPRYPPVQVPGVMSVSGAEMHSLAQPLAFSFDSAASTYLMRGQIPDGPQQEKVLNAVLQHPDVRAVFSDPLIQSTITCGPAPMGSASDVATLLSVKQLAAAGRTGKGVFLAIVDTGINLAYLKSRGLNPRLDVAKSFVPPGVPNTPGNHPVAHGTMCAFDTAIAAPEATLLDYAVLLTKTDPRRMAGLLSDAVLAYQKLRTVLTGLPAARRALVVSNSWGMFSPDSDFPVGHPGNYSDNPNHPFNIIVGSLEAAGADILFAAGNCGKECPDIRCHFGTKPSICGANSHPAVLSIAGVDTRKNRVGYSSQGPGRLTAKKPDIASYTQFSGSQVDGADSGTSAACPVAAGVVCAIRTKFPTTQLSPLQLRSLLYQTAEDRGPPGYDFDYGYGIIDPAALLGALPKGAGGAKKGSAATAKGAAATTKGSAPTSKGSAATAKSSAAKTKAVRKPATKKKASRPPK